MAEYGEYAVGNTTNISVGYLARNLNEHFTDHQHATYCVVREDDPAKIEVHILVYGAGTVAVHYIHHLFLTPEMLDYYFDGHVPKIRFSKTLAYEEDSFLMATVNDDYVFSELLFRGHLLMKYLHNRTSGVFDHFEHGNNATREEDEEVDRVLQFKMKLWDMEKLRRRAIPNYF